MPRSLLRQSSRPCQTYLMRSKQSKNLFMSPLLKLMSDTAGGRYVLTHSVKMWLSQGIYVEENFK